MLWPSNFLFGNFPVCRLRITGMPPLIVQILTPWPEGNVPQQTHLEFSVPDLDIAEEQALAIGARKSDFQPGERF